MTGSGLLVFGLKEGGKDAAGVTVEKIYAKRTPEYAVYQIPGKVAVHFADDAALQKEQRAAILTLNPLRNSITSLIAHWRRSGNAPQQESVQLFDQRIADALVLGLEGDLQGGMALLTTLQTDVADERASWGRFHYLGITFGIVIASLLVIWFILCSSSNMSPMVWALWFAAGSGIVGAFFSLAIGIRSRTIATALSTRDIFVEASLRLIIGVIAAAVLVVFVKLGLFDLQVGEVSVAKKVLPLQGEEFWLAVIAIGFIAGFSERLVPNLLEKLATQPAGKFSLPAEAVRQPGRAPAADKAASSAESEAAAVREDLPEAEKEEDACLSDAPIRPEEGTPDAELPAATGGVNADKPASRT